MPDIEDQIQKAIEAGKFDNLPGKGKPLRLDDDSYVDPEWRLAHHMIKSSGFTLPWIETRQEILAALESARQNLKRAWEWRQQALDRQPVYDVEAEWQRAQTVFQDQIQAINKKIFNYNLETPSERLQLPALNAPREISAATVATD